MYPVLMKQRPKTKKQTDQIGYQIQSKNNNFGLIIYSYQHREMKDLPELPLSLHWSALMNPQIVFDLQILDDSILDDFHKWPSLPTDYLNKIELYWN